MARTNAVGERTKEAARSLAEGFIDYQPRTSDEVRRRLLRAGFDAGVVDEVVRDLELAGLLDDRRFCRDWVESRFRSKGLGPARLRDELIRKGASKQNVEEALRLVDGEALLDRALEAARRWAERVDVTDAKARARLAGYLRRRGYDWDCIEQVCAILLPNK